MILFVVTIVTLTFTGVSPLSEPQSDCSNVVIPTKCTQAKEKFIQDGAQGTQETAQSMRQYLNVTCSRECLLPIVRNFTCHNSTRQVNFTLYACYLHKTRRRWLLPSQSIARTFRASSPAIHLQFGRVFACFNLSSVLSCYSESIGLLRSHLFWQPSKPVFHWVWKVFRQL